jgi:sulfatase maturation enzyme AslB (radical SAM superfamily)
VLPWVHRFVNLGGEVQLCCTAEEHPDSYVLGDDGRPLNIKDGATDEDIDGTRYMREVKSAMLRGEWPAACERCRVTEASGGHSRRCSENEHFASHIDWILANTDEHGLAPSNIRSRDYRLGNLCNLRCRMCHPNASKLLLPEWNQVSRFRHRIRGAAAEWIEQMDWFRNESFWTDFRDHAGQLEHLHFAGGEPLIIKEVQEALEICVELGVAGQIELTFNTNLTKLPRAHRELWPHFKTVNLLCSVDAQGALNDYIRYPAKWPQIERHLDLLDREHAQLNLGRVRLSATVQIYNIFHLAELVDYARQRFSFIDPVPQLIHLAVPDYFNVQNLPSALKDLAAERLMDLRDRLLTEGLEEGASQVSAILTYLRQGRHALSRMAEFARVTERFDSLRGESLLDLVPELTPVIEAGGARHRLELAVDGMRWLGGRVVGKARRETGKAVKRLGRGGSGGVSRDGGTRSD